MRWLVPKRDAREVVVVVVVPHRHVQVRTHATQQSLDPLFDEDVVFSCISASVGPVSPHGEEKLIQFAHEFLAVIAVELSYPKIRACRLLKVCPEFHDPLFNPCR